MKTDKFYYVLLLDSLANILKLEDFQAEPASAWVYNASCSSGSVTTSS